MTLYMRTLNQAPSMTPILGGGLTPENHNSPQRSIAASLRQVGQPSLFFKKLLQNRLDMLPGR